MNSSVVRRGNKSRHPTTVSGAMSNQASVPVQSHELAVSRGGCWILDLCFCMSFQTLSEHFFFPTRSGTQLESDWVRGGATSDLSLSRGYGRPQPFVLRLNRLTQSNRWSLITVAMVKFTKNSLLNKEAIRLRWLKCHVAHSTFQSWKFEL